MYPCKNTAVFLNLEAGPVHQNHLVSHLVSHLVPAFGMIWTARSRRREVLQSNFGQVFFLISFSLSHASS